MAKHTTPITVSALTEAADALWDAQKHTLFNADGTRKKDYSDVEDEHGRQIIDLVQEGGGMLGIALVGFTYILEKAGLRFASLAGTSAGGINAMLLASIDDAIYTADFEGNSKSKKIAEIISQKDFFEFVDGGPFVKWLCKFLFQEVGANIRYKIFGISLLLLCMSLSFGLFWLTAHIFQQHPENDLLRNALLWTGGTLAAFAPLALLGKLFQWLLGKKIGLNRGAAFSQWMQESIEKQGIHTYRDLKTTRLNDIPVVSRTTRSETAAVRRRLVMITSNITYNRICKFPEAAEDYWQQPDQVAPSEFVRATMSIPFFFDVYQPKEAAEKSPNMAFVDGGMLSNFPLREFHDYSKPEPRYPTFGVKIGKEKSDKEKSMGFSLSFTGYLGALIATFRGFYDDDYLRNNAEAQDLIGYIKTKDAQGKEVNWLAFNLSNETKQYLFLKGADAAIKHLEAFKWDDYKATRRESYRKFNMA